VVLRPTAGRVASPVGEVTAVASEHDRPAGTERGSNTAALPAGTPRLYCSLLNGLHDGYGMHAALTVQ
jgi:hypothetical protein